jgi:hypothetical protein
MRQLDIFKTESFRPEHRRFLAMRSGETPVFGMYPAPMVPRAQRCPQASLPRKRNTGVSPLAPLGRDDALKPVTVDRSEGSKLFRAQHNYSVGSATIQWSANYPEGSKIVQGASTAAGLRGLSLPRVSTAVTAYAAAGAGCRSRKAASVTSALLSLRAPSRSRR